MRDEYDFSKGVRGTHAARYAAGVHVVVDDVPTEKTVTLAPDVAEVFSDSDGVNAALRLLIKAGQAARDLSKAS